MCIQPRFVCTPDWIDIVGIFQLFISFSAAILTIVGLVKLSTKYRNETFVKHRELPLTITFTVFVVGELTINRTFLEGYSIFYWWGFDVFPYFNTNHVPSQWIFILTYSFFWWTTFALNALRIWKLYYIQQYNVRITDYCWVSSLNAEHGNLEKDWFIKNKLKWGSTCWLMRIFIPFALLSITLGPLTAALFHDLWPHFLNMVWMIVPVIFGWIILYKTNNVVDVYGIKNELLYSTLVITCLTAAFDITFILFTFFNITEFSLTSYRINWLIYSCWGVLLMSLIGLITAIYPIYYNTSEKKNAKYSKITQMGMNDTLNNKKGFRMFMQHLALCEFSTEVILFIVELTQIKNYIINNHSVFDFRTQKTRTKISATFIETKYSGDDEICVDEIDNLNSIYLCQGLIISPIIIKQQKENNINIAEIMLYMYNKYISTKSKCPIALSYRNNIRIKRILFDDINHSDISVSGTSTSFNLMTKVTTHSFVDDFDCKYEEPDETSMVNMYDSVAVELLYCLHDSFIRFQTNKKSYVELSKFFV